MRVPPRSVLVFAAPVTTSNGNRTPSAGIGPLPGALHELRQFRHPMVLHELRRGSCRSNLAARTGARLFDGDKEKDLQCPGTA
uniref:Putative secreted peptide n=1 Tax=Anopheles braziliensis TaxID=58242 RepID=A0A2M3ZPK0_9DIPT